MPLKRAYVCVLDYTVHPNQELVCLEHQMRCEDNTICIWESFWCDDETDCVDNSDEQNCDQYHSRCDLKVGCGLRDIGAVEIDTLGNIST